jgi:SAM-dependent methyltransferase
MNDVCEYCKTACDFGEARYRESMQKTRSEEDTSAWNGRYEEHGQHMWSGQPNGSLETELTNQTPGRVLDLGCGEGADAIWLATLGWEVTATDISDVAIERARQAADGAGVTVDFRTDDAITHPPSESSFDLVIMSYPALAREAGLIAMQAIAKSVVRGGELMVIGHSLHETHSADDHGFNPDDYVSIDDIIEVTQSDFSITLDEIRVRPNAPEGNPHSTDRILRATRG